MADFSLEKSFHIDNGELDGLRLQEAFVLGYELASIDHQLTQPAAISRPVHSRNRERIIESCEMQNRPYSLTWPADDVSEEWMQLEVPSLSTAS